MELSLAVVQSMTTRYRKCRLATACITRRCECERGQSDRLVGRINDKFRRTDNEYNDCKERWNE
ncbi:hypothetical protein K503DRAFT_161088 [Rhizopogon vinicolor AM-OR11-026]|uniref:Uncharacterized protein n=1 Tax=Rhizopogon vinicolor AM-OR11-026 TaxID=1314800 RepID=A0A1B7ME11_9AGAM|nr:hypothetical protein K503DRAFT_161088 [Rhizopogon vinicolor AM-OR11-026]